MRNQINLTDEQIEQRFESLGVSSTVDDLVFTGETIDHWLDARKSWREPGKLERDGDSVIIYGAQVAAGQPRSDVFIVDFGSVRAVYK